MKRGTMAMGVCVAQIWAVCASAQNGGAALAKPTPAPKASQVPTIVGTCARTTITEIGDRFGGSITGAGKSDPATGTAVSYANGGYQISYSRVAALERSKVGDSVMVCLISVPKDCPKGDDRGRVYTTTNLRSGDVWSMPDSQHMCGGA
ncbi:hypothetical protein [Methylobacterium marchantiae]|uniref:Secreted protein n=1 Tax=Methylobacterium marchantiae TaxID=600331 RepID=A0ABW3WTS7_9HYPH|nr:hypothetical protein AIGOOFII_2431 [Methylobacterium marchantiae]